MKNIYRISGVIIFIIVTQSCKKEVDNTIKDVDGNVYNTVTIGTQVWMKENLKTTKYRNGDLIGTTTPATLNTDSEITPKYQWAVEGNESKVVDYGRLYTWYAVTDSRNICPSGWHVPSDAEWTTLKYYLIDNGYGNEGSGEDIAKSMASTSGWTTVPTAGNVVGNDQASNNSSGFTAVPSGYRYRGGGFLETGSSTCWWSSSEYSDLDAYILGFSCLDFFVGQSISRKYSGYSVRCLRD